MSETAGEMRTTAQLRQAAAIFLVFLALYLFTWAGHYTTGDGAHKIAWAQAMLFGQSANGVAPDSNGVYSKYGIGHSLVAIPAIAIAGFVRKGTGIRCEAALYTLIFVFNGALLMGLLAYYLLRHYERKRVWWTIALVGLATTWWPYTKLDFSEALVCTALFGGFVTMRFGRPAPGMLLASLAITIRSDSIILVALLAVWWLCQRRSIDTAFRLALAAAPALAISLAANQIRYGSVVERGYAGETFSTPILQGLFGILFSAGKSVFVFSPPLLLGFFGWRKFSQRPEMREDAWLFLSVFAAQLLIYSRWWDWSSDDAWGVRFMLVGVILMCIPAVEIVHRRKLTLIAAGLGVLVQLLAVLPGPLEYELLLRSQKAQREALFFSGTNRVDFEDLRFNPRYGQIAGHWILVRELLHWPPQPGLPQAAGKSGTALFDTLPASSWSGAAHWDFIWARGRDTDMAARPESSSAPIQR